MHAKAKGDSTFIPLALLAALAIVVAVLGGSSQHRIIQLAGLRPLVALLLIPAVYYWRAEARPDAPRDARVLLTLLLALAGWMLIQLVPLPPFLWENLPDREIIAQLDRALALDPQWRPIAWVPTRGWNALASLIVPLVALLLALSAGVERARLFQIILAIALIDAALNVLQIATGGPGYVYLYASGSLGADGLFSNENHSGVFSALGLMIAARLGLDNTTAMTPWQRIAYASAFMVLLLALLIGGSRAGFVAGVGAMIGALAMLYLSNLAPGAGRAGTDNRAALTTIRRRFLMGSVLLVTGLVSLFLWLERAPGFGGILSQSSFDDLRWELTPVLQEMLSRNWLAGIGFGSFEEYYHIYEPRALLRPKFINMAHNDWAQMLLEGGAPAIVLLLCLVFWITRKLAALFRQGPAAFPVIVFWAAILAIVSAASFVDYPLRTPLFQMVMAWLLFALGQDAVRSFEPPIREARARRRRRSD